MTSLWQRLKGPSGGIPHQSPDQSLTTTKMSKSWSIRKSPTDPNAPVPRLQLHQRCLYERHLPGNAFISAHVNRLQHGFYQSDKLHEEDMSHVYFVSVHFVFHPTDTRAHRFKNAVIRVAVHGDFDPEQDPKRGWYYPQSNPRILKHAPELIYGAVSPENLQWNFSLSSSLGVSQTPLSASLNPSGGVKGSYKIYDMMSIQGSLRTLTSPFGPEYDIEDGVAVWTLQENLLQRSGLPREFDFVLLIHKPDDVNNVFMSVDVDSVVETWYGEYPQWYMNLPKYQPSQQFLLDFHREVGQKFVPEQSGKGFNFADLPHPIEHYVAMPGTTYPTNDSIISDESKSRPKSAQQAIQKQTPQNRSTGTHAHQPTSPGSHASPTRQRRSSSHAITSNGQPITPNRHSWVPDTMNVRVVLEHQFPSQSPSSNRYSTSPLSTQDSQRRRSIRRTRSRSGLKEYGAQQALHEIAKETLNAG